MNIQTDCLPFLLLLFLCVYFIIFVAVTVKIVDTSITTIRWSVEVEKRAKVHNQPSTKQRRILYLEVTCNSYCCTHCNRDGSLCCADVLLICQQVNAIEMFTASIYIDAQFQIGIEIESEFFFSCSAGIDSSISNGAANQADSSKLQAAGFVSGQPSSMTSKSPSTAGLSELSTTTPATVETPNELSSRAIEFHEGWTPILYT